MRRRWMLTGVWAICTLAATLVAWGAVRLVADQVSPSPVSALPTAVALADLDAVVGESEAAATPRARATRRPNARATAAPNRPGREQPASGAEPPADEPDPQQPVAGDAEDEEQVQDPEPVATTQAYDLVGGVVTVRYQGTSTRLVEASPNSGFVVEVQDGGPGKVDVRFRSDEHESRFVTRVRDGRPDPQREERPR